MKTLFPRLRFDWTDAVVAGEPAVRVAAMLRVTPSAWFAFACMLTPALRPALPVAVGLLLWRLNPFLGPIRDLMRARGPRPLKENDAQEWFFSRNGSFRESLFARLSSHGFAHAWSLAAVSAIWIAAALMYAGGLFFGSVTTVFSHGETGIVPALAGLLAIGVALIAAFVTNEWIHWRSRLPRVPVVTPAAPAGPHDLALLSPVLSALPEGVRDEAVDSARSASFAPGSGVTGVGAAGEDLCVVRDGEFEVISRDGEGRETLATILRRGDVFGEFPVFGTLFRSRNLRAVGRAEILSVTTPGIEQTLMRHLSVPAFEEAMRRVFLRELPLLAGCLPETVSTLAARVRASVSYPGDPAFPREAEVRRFAIVFDGEYEIRRAGKVRGKLRSRDTFGEISALRGETPDELIAVIASTILILRRDDFFALCGSDPVFALRIEENASRLLGSPVLPFTPTD